MKNIQGKQPNRRQIIGLVAAAMSLPAMAQNSSFPQRPVRIVVPYTTGGSNDVIARLLAQQLQEAWGQPVVVENKPGAAGNIGASDIAKSAPDGHSLLLTNINIVSMNPGLIANMPFDPQKDFAPISLLGTTALALVVHPSVQANNVRELIDLARKGPGRLNYASSGNGSPQHMSAEMFKAMTKTSLTHIPYRGAAPAVNDLLAGQVQVTVGVVNQLIPHIRAGKLKALGVTTRKRLVQMPDVPTLDEAGVPGYESEIWLGLAAPAGTPPAIIEQINQAIRKAMASADVIGKLQAQGIDAMVSSPDQMRQRGLEDLKRWGDIIRTAGIKVD
ncbi:tripartite tricarboxylate transporter substrate binding protein [Limnohabitans sp. G3-2]|uniref:Bug family tripartite tricarboxylate transporter substrate binding protein n=1 Tax=Limnohabitans sp. G3-2 TaxID=1100711 RepID=UPI001E6026E1|nr:tripartite tricarboxylate transporter substrate binding protein [Limnohabitans sp. G3-2]